MNNFELLALQYAERYGVITYKVKKNLMIFYKTYRGYLSNKPYSVKHIINLSTGVETTETLQRVVKEGYDNV